MSKRPIFLWTSPRKATLLGIDLGLHQRREVMLAAGFTICLHSSWRLTILAFTVLTPVVHISANFSAWAAKLMTSQPGGLDSAVEVGPTGEI